MCLLDRDMATTLWLFPTLQVHAPWVCLHLSTLWVQPWWRSRDNSPQEVESPTGICSYLQLIWIDSVSTFWSCLYHHCNCLPPPKANNNFIHHFAALLTHLATLFPKCNSAGGLQHTYGKYLPFTHDFASCLDIFGFQQHNDFPIHSKGHILDLVFCTGLIPSNCIEDEFPKTDHLRLSFNVQLTLSSTKPPTCHLTP